MYVLHYAPDNASLVVRLALEELGVPYRTVLVDRAAEEQKSPAYRALCPTGLVPVFETDDGPIFETGAILLWLADRHGRLAPSATDPDRGAFLSWFFFLSNTLHADLIELFHPERFAAGDAEGHRALNEARIRGHLSLLEEVLSGHPGWCTPGAPGMFGCYLAPMIRWVALYPSNAPMKPPLAPYPSIGAILSALEGRAAARRAAEAEGLGPTPFTSPRPIQPRELNTH